MSKTLLETVVIEPKQSAKSVVIWLHGLGADGHDFASIVPQLNLPDEQATRFIFPHAPMRPITINGGATMRGWYDIAGLDLQSKEDAEGILASEASIHQLIQQQIEQGIDSQQIILAGFSQGGALALFTGLRYPQALGGLLILSAYLPLREQLITTVSTNNRQTPIMMAHGKNDQVLPFMFGKGSSDALKAFGYSVQWFEYMMEHQVCFDEINDISQWLQKVAVTAE